MQEEGDPAYSYRGGPGALKVIRGRGCDESFRAAVDVDYNKHLVDPNHRSETSKFSSKYNFNLFIISSQCFLKRKRESNGSNYPLF